MILGCLVGFGDGLVVGTTLGVGFGDVLGLLPSSSEEDSDEDDASSPNADVGFRLTLG